jgi:membrane protein
MRGVWRVQTETLPPGRRAGVRGVRFVWCCLRDFLRNQCTQQASALTYTTLMSLVPVLAVMFAFAKGMGAHEKIRGALENNANIPPYANEAIVRLLDAVEKVNFATIGAIGSVLLLWTVINTMSQVEGSFNRIWRVAAPRTWVRRFQAYLSIVLVVPIFMLAAASVTPAVKTTAVHDFLTTHLGVFYPVVRVGISLLGMSSVIIGLSLLYMFMPNTRVKAWSALAGGLVAGASWYAMNSAFISFQIGVAKNNAIYGTFAAIPFFLLWVYAGWIIVLAGAEFCYVFQNRLHLRFIVEPPPLSFAGRGRLGLLMVQEISAAHLAGEAPWAASAFAERHRLPLPMIGGILLVLVRNGVLAEGAVPGTYLPARDIHALTPADVEHAFRHDVADSGSPITLVLPEGAAAQQLFDAESAAFEARLRRESFADLAVKPQQPR